MTDIVLKDIDPALRARIEQVAQVHGWSLPEALQKLLDAGLQAIEGGRRPTFDGREEGILAEAIEAMEQVPNDPGFALIGRAGPTDQAPG